MNYIIEEIKELVNQGFGLSIEYWFGVSILLLLAYILFVQIYSKKNVKENRKSNLNFNLKISSLDFILYIFFLLLTFVFIIFVFFYEDFFITKNYSLDIIISVLLVVSIEFYMIFKLKHGVKSKLPKYIKPQISEKNKIASGEFITKRFEKTKYKSFIVIIPFLILLLTYTFERKSLVSVLIDNSGSTELHRSFGQRALSESLNSINEDSDISITFLESFDDNFMCEEKIKMLKQNVEDIISESNWVNLSAENYFFNSSNEAANFLNSIPIKPSCIGSPILESTWANFIYTLESSDSKNYQNKLFVLLTDGMDNMYLDNYEGVIRFKTPDLNFSIFEEKNKFFGLNMIEFYDKIYIINIGENQDQGIFTHFGVNKTFNGQDKTSYEEALSSITSDIQKRNWFFVYSISLLTIIFLFLLILTNLRPKY